jgi:threonyl-tRNA synthetase
MAAPTRFELAYVGRDGQEHRPAMLHRAILGSLERFIAIYLEHTAGDFPLWLAPLQAVVLPITDRHADYAAKVGAALQAAGLRAECDVRNEKLNFKIREAELQKSPLMRVVGDQEVANGTVTPRRRHGTKGAAESVALDAFVLELSAAVAERRESI